MTVEHSIRHQRCDEQARAASLIEVIIETA
jgi:hypothetical protein